MTDFKTGALMGLWASGILLWIAMVILAMWFRDMQRRLERVERMVRGNIEDPYVPHQKDLENARRP